MKQQYKTFLVCYLSIILMFIIPFPLHGQTDNLSNIREAIANYNYEQALELINENSDNNSSAVISLQTQTLKGLHRYSEAITLLKQYLAKDSTDIPLTVQLAECYKLSGQPAEAVRYYSKALDIQPENKYIRLQLISLLLNTGNYKEAQPIGSTFIEQDSSTLSLRLMGQIYEGQKQADSALIHYRLAVEKTPTDYLSVALYANKLCECRDLETALEVTENYRIADSLNIPVNQQNAKAYFFNKDYATAVERYKQLIKAGDNTFQTHYYLGVCYFAEEYFYEAHDHLEIADKRKPNDVHVLYYLGRANAKTSWKEEGVEQLERAIEIITPKDSTMEWLYTGLADCYHCRHNKEDPYNRIEALKQVYKYNPNKRSTLYNIGVIYQRQKNYPQALRYLEQFLKTESANANNTPKLDENGAIDGGETMIYNAARQRIKEIKEEKFWQGE